MGVIAAAVPAATPREGDGIDTVGVGLLGEDQERVPAGAGEDGGTDERVAEAVAPVPDNGLEPPGTGHVGVTGRERLVPLGQTVEEGTGEGVGIVLMFEV